MVFVASFTLGCNPPDRPQSPDAGHTAAQSTSDHSGSWYVQDLWVNHVTLSDSGDLCVFAESVWTYRSSGYGPSPVAMYRWPLDFGGPQPEPQPALDDTDGVAALSAWVDDTCVLASQWQDGSRGVLYAVDPRGGVDPRFGRIDLPAGTFVTALTRDGENLWASGHDQAGGFVQRYGRDGRAEPPHRLPAVPRMLRVVRDGFVFASIEPTELWRVDEAGQPVAAWGDGGRVLVPEDRFHQYVTFDLDDAGNALFVNVAADDGLIYTVLRRVGADGVSAPPLFLPDGVYAMLWDGDGQQLWIEGGQVTRRDADGGVDQSWGTLELPSDEGPRYFTRQRAGTAVLFATWYETLSDWTSLRVSPR